MAICKKCKNYNYCKLNFKDKVEKCYFCFSINTEEYEKGYKDGYAKAIDEFVSTLVSRLTDAIYQKDVESMTNLINGVAEELKEGEIDEN